eukprot:scaffold95419_cov19-Tisochrysis_lutea.AAC.3
MSGGCKLSQFNKHTGWLQNPCDGFSIPMVACVCLSLGTPVHLRKYAQCLPPIDHMLQLSTPCATELVYTRTAAL